MFHRSVRQAGLLVFITCLFLFAGPERSGYAQDKPATLELKKGDRIAWVGSSSTNIGVWPKTMEFLLRTRHPDLHLTFKKFSTGGGTFATGVQNLDKWLADFQPTVVFLNYGGNDAGTGEKGLPQYKENMARCVAKIEAARGRFLFTIFQGADVRKSGEAPAAQRVAEAQIAFCKEKGWPFVDVFHPTQALQDQAQKENDKYTILRDGIHLTDSAYIAWGYYLYDGLKLPGGVSEATLDVSGMTPKATTVGCKVGALEWSKEKNGLQFTRADAVLPILPPGPLPPRAYVPLERCSDYRLRVTGLKAGKYAVHCEEKSLGTVTAEALAKGINLNSLVLESGATPAWQGLATQVWAGKGLEKIGQTAFTWRVVRSD